jgi:hypothetical protein
VECTHADNAASRVNTCEGVGTETRFFNPSDEDSFEDAIEMVEVIDAKRKDSNDVLPTVTNSSSTASKERSTEARWPSSTTATAACRTEGANTPQTGLGAKMQQDGAHERRPAPQCLGRSGSRALGRALRPP